MLKEAVTHDGLGVATTRLEWRVVYAAKMAQFFVDGGPHTHGNVVGQIWSSFDQVALSFELKPEDVVGTRQLHVSSL